MKEAAKMRCQHEVPCTCEEYLSRLSEEQLLNLRIEFGKVLCVNDRFNSLRRNKKEASRQVAAVNQFLKQKYGYIVV